jgi:acetamidase/formamidase
MPQSATVNGKKRPSLSIMLHPARAVRRKLENRSGQVPSADLSCADSMTSVSYTKVSATVFEGGPDRSSTRATRGTGEDPGTHMTEHILSAMPTHSRWNRALAPRLVVEPGDTVHLECLDSSGAQVHPTMTLPEYLAIDRGRIHALTGPIFVKGAEPGDVLQVDVLAVTHKGWGWSSVVPGLGFLKNRFSDPSFFLWQLESEVSRSLMPAVVPLRPFCGVMGVAPAEEGEFRTRPPGRFGGNMDVRELSSGATLYLPVLNSGALFSAGDAHAAQGDGEVCITIEMPLKSCTSALCT